MSAPAQSREERALHAFLLAALLISGIVLVFEGPHYDNVIDGWVFFSCAFFAGALIGLLVWTYTSGTLPVLNFSGAYRLPWLAALVAGLVSATTASYINRTYAAPPHRTILATVDSVAEGKGSRWHLTVKIADDEYQRYLISKGVADALKNSSTIRMGIARGAFGFDFVAKFEPAG